MKVLLDGLLLLFCVALAVFGVMAMAPHLAHITESGSLPSLGGDALPAEIVTAQGVAPGQGGKWQPVASSSFPSPAPIATSLPTDRPVPTAFPAQPMAPPVATAPLFPMTGPVAPPQAAARGDFATEDQSRDMTGLVPAQAAAAAGVYAAGEDWSGDITGIDGPDPWRILGWVLVGMAPAGIIAAVGVWTYRNWATIRILATMEAERQAAQGAGPASPAGQQEEEQPVGLPMVDVGEYLAGRV